jgi:hypothetical protein
LIGSTALLLVSLLASRANAHGAPADLVKARQLFGVENVDARTGTVDRDKVILAALPETDVEFGSFVSLGFMVYDPKDARWSKGRRSREHDDDHDD